MAITLAGHNALRGRSLAVVLKQALDDLTKDGKELTREELADYLINKYQPGMNKKGKDNLMERLRHLLNELVTSNLVNRTPHNTHIKVTQYTYGNART